MRGENAVRITELEDRIDKLQKEIKAEREKILTLESPLQQVWIQIAFYYDWSKQEVYFDMKMRLVVLALLNNLQAGRFQPGLDEKQLSVYLEEESGVTMLNCYINPALKIQSFSHFLNLFLTWIMINARAFKAKYDKSLFKLKLS